MIYHVYTDGGARGNGQDTNCPCGAGVYIEELERQWCDNLKFENGNTNQKAELYAAIKGLMIMYDYFTENQIAFGDIVIYSDSAYVINGMNSWIHNWKANGWINSKKEEVKNKELWMQLSRLQEIFEDMFITVHFEKVKGHADNKGNQIADALVNKAMDRAEREGKEFTK